MKDIRQQWKALASARNIKSEDIAALCIYKSLVESQGKEGAIAMLHKSFSPIKNPNKLSNGRLPNESLKTALYFIKYSTFATWLEDEDKQLIISMDQEIAKEIK